MNARLSLHASVAPPLHLVWDLSRTHRTRDSAKGARRVARQATHMSARRTSVKDTVKELEVEERAVNSRAARPHLPRLPVHQGAAGHADCTPPNGARRGVRRTPREPRCRARQMGASPGRTPQAEDAPLAAYDDAGPGEASRRGRAGSMDGWGERPARAARQQRSRGPLASGLCVCLVVQRVCLTGGPWRARDLSPGLCGAFRRRGGSPCVEARRAHTLSP